MRTSNGVLLAFILGLSSSGLWASDKFITLASTTSTENSGLFDVLLPEFESQTGIAVRVVAVGTGQAIRIARNGDADVLLVHHTPSEEAFVADGHGVERFGVMYNDFVIVGPHVDPAQIRGANDVAAALREVAERQQPFLSRGDDSGTHKKELALWQTADVDVASTSGVWYAETGSGMGATLNTASAMNAYALTDRATWLKFANKGELELLVEGDRRLFNQYGIILVDAAKHPHVKTANGQTFVEWVISKKGQNTIASYRIAGEQAFFPNAR